MTDNINKDLIHLEHRLTTLESGLNHIGDSLDDIKGMLKDHVEKESELTVRVATNSASLKIMKWIIGSSGILGTMLLTAMKLV